MQNLDLYIVKSWCRAGLLIFLFDADSSEEKVFDQIITTMKEEGLYHEYFWFCLLGFQHIKEYDDERRVRSPRSTDEEITIVKLPINVPKDDRFISYAYVDVGTKFWNFKEVKDIGQ